MARWLITLAILACGFMAALSALLHLLPQVHPASVVLAQSRSDVQMSRWPLNTEILTEKATSERLATFMLQPGERGLMACEPTPKAGFGNVLNAVYAFYVLARLLNRTWVRNDPWATAFDRPGDNSSWGIDWPSESVLVEGTPEIHWHKRKGGMQSKSSRSLWLPCAELAALDSPMLVLPVRFCGRQGNELLKCITWLTSHDPHALAVYRRMVELALQSQPLHPSGVSNWLRTAPAAATEAVAQGAPLPISSLAGWVQATQPHEQESILRARIMQDVVAARPSAVLRPHLLELQRQLAAAATEQPPATRCMHIDGAWVASARDGDDEHGVHDDEDGVWPPERLSMLDSLPLNDRIFLNDPELARLAARRRAPPSPARPPMPIYDRCAPTSLPRRSPASVCQRPRPPTHAPRPHARGFTVTKDGLPAAGMRASDLARATPAVLPAHDGVLGLQIRSWRDAQEMGSRYHYDATEDYEHFWRCARATLRRLLARLAQRLGRPARVLVWLTSDVLPETSARFYAEMAMPGAVLATPACEPTPRRGIAEHSKQSKGEAPFRALAHWWALGASDALVVTLDSTFGYTAWLRSHRTFQHQADGVLDVVLPAHQPNGTGSAQCALLHDQIEW